MIVLGRPARQTSCRLSIFGKNFNVAVFLNTLKYDVTLCIIVVLIELYPFTPFSVTVIIFQGHSRVRQVLINFVCLFVFIWLSWNFVRLLTKLKLCIIVWLCQVNHEYTTVYCFCTFLKDIIDIFLIWKKKSHKIFKTLHDYLAWGLHCPCRFDDLDFVSRLQVCQKYKLQIMF